MKRGLVTSVVPIDCFHVNFENFKPLTGSNSGKNLSSYGIEATLAVMKAESWIHSSIQIY